jgi:hypothetical protein
MQARFGNARRKPAAAGRAILGVLVVGILAAPLAACSSTSEATFLFAEPGKYAYYNCPQLAVELKNWTKRQQELKSLLDRADQSAGGTAVGLLAYRGDYVNAGEELQMLHTTAHNKNCEQDEAWRSSTAIR